MKDINKKSFDEWANLVYCYQNLLKYKEGIKAYEAAIEIEPENSVIYLNYGSLFQEMGDKEKASFYYKVSK